MPNPFYAYKQFYFKQFSLALKKTDLREQLFGLSLKNPSSVITDIYIYIYKIISDFGTSF